MKLKFNFILFLSFAILTVHFVAGASDQQRRPWIINRIEQYFEHTIEETLIENTRVTSKKISPVIFGTTSQD